jgi:hypothetical protein
VPFCAHGTVKTVGAAVAASPGTRRKRPDDRLRMSAPAPVLPSAITFVQILAGHRDLAIRKVRRGSFDQSLVL